MRVHQSRFSEVCRAALVIAVVLVGCTEAEPREPTSDPADASPTARTDAMTPAPPSPDVPIAPGRDRDATMAADEDAASAIAPVPVDAAIPGDAEPPREGPSLESLDAGIRDETDSAEPDPDRVSCRSSTDCAPSEVCFFSRVARCGAGDVPGRCVARPTPGSCSSTARTVCGCDGHSYPNACHAWESGTDVASDGACP